MFYTLANHVFEHTAKATLLPSPKWVAQILANDGHLPLFSA